MAAVGASCSSSPLIFEFSCWLMDIALLTVWEVFGLLLSVLFAFGFVEVVVVFLTGEKLLNLKTGLSRTGYDK